MPFLFYMQIRMFLIIEIGFFPLIFRYLIWNINVTITKKRQLPHGSKLGGGGVWGVLNSSTCATNHVTCTNKVLKLTWLVPFGFLNGAHLLLYGICIRKIHNICNENGRSNWELMLFDPTLETHIKKGKTVISWQTISKMRRKFIRFRAPWAPDHTHC